MKLSESSFSVKFKRIVIDGKEYVPGEVYDEVIAKHQRSRDTIHYLLDKWFETIEKRMADQDRLLKMIDKVERANNRGDRLAAEIEKMLKSTGIKIGSSRPAFEKP